MTKVTVSKKDIQKFLLSFGKDLIDLRIVCENNCACAEIAFSSYYMRKILPATVTESGTLHIADLQKALKFIKASKNEHIEIRQTATDKPLHIVSGGNKLQIPSTNNILSASKVPIIKKLMKLSADTSYTVFGNSGIKLTAHGRIDATDLTALNEMSSLVSKESDFVLRMHPGEQEFGLVAGKMASGRLFTTLPMSNTDGPNATVQSKFGEWLPKCLSYLEEQTTDVHMGDNTLVIFEQDNTTLMVVDVAE